MKKLIVLIIILSMHCFLLSNCQKKSENITHKTPIAKWEPYITSHTAGIISRESIIRIRFAIDAIPEERIGKHESGKILFLKPAVNGKVIFTDRRTLEFHPDKRLSDGQKYEVTLKLDKLFSVPPECKNFKFRFMTLQQDYEVRIERLYPVTLNDIQSMRAEGSIVTTDNEEGDNVEKTVTAFQDEKSLHVEWSHNPNKRTHRFIVNNIVRKNEESKFTITVAGKNIGVKRDTTVETKVTSLDDFVVESADAVYDGGGCVLIRFSDPIDQAIDLRGLISLNSGKEQAKLSVDKNEIRLYPTSTTGENVTITLYPGIKSTTGKVLKRAAVMNVVFKSLAPQVSFTGKGVIVPRIDSQTVYFECVNLRAIEVRAIRVYETNIPQFLQVNMLDGEREIRRVGRTVWKKRIPIEGGSPNRWIRGGFDLAPLLAMEPNALYRLELKIYRDDAIVDCANETGITISDEYKLSDSLESANEDNEYQYSYWNYYDEDYDWENYYRNRNNPCHASYYHSYNMGNNDGRRNFLFTNIALMAKSSNYDTLTVVVADLLTAMPIAGAAVYVYNYQNHLLATGKSGSDGMCKINTQTTPFLVTAEKDGRKSYLRVNAGSELSMSLFDVSGVAVQKGIKGFIYGERGVWRPGDSIFLTFVLEDRAKIIPAEHPVVFELINPRGQVVSSLVRTSGIDCFYSFATSTMPDAPTGEYVAKVRVGGAVFTQSIKIEAIVPNRLKVKLDLGSDTIQLDHSSIFDAGLESKWLHGAPARNLKFDLAVTLQPTPTVFRRYADFNFDDPAKSFNTMFSELGEGRLDNTGNGRVSFTLLRNASSPGMLKASFRTRIFEEGGLFSIDRLHTICSPYSRYIGILIPKGDKERGMLLTDTSHSVKIISLAPNGKMASGGKAICQIYKMRWRWWWEKGEENLADFISSYETKLIRTDTVNIGNGETSWQFQIDYPEWGRYYIKVTDARGGHSTGRIVYIDWPSWAGRSQSNAPNGAIMLSFSSDKETYNVGENAVLTVPSDAGGRILVSIENGTRILRSFWVDSKEKATLVTLPITNNMTPTAYASLAYIQPHGQTKNDLPIRMYGVIPLKIVDHTTVLKPVIKVPPVFKPDNKGIIRVSESSGREMVYTLAVVDEGLLDLTRFPTPDPWNAFFQREALGVRTWDMYDLVSGAWGARIDRLIAIGGDDGHANPPAKRGNRFPPMVKFAGPFHLKKNAVDVREIDIPRYVGSVRVMVVGGFNGSYGKADTSVYVRNPLMILGALPRVLSPLETVSLPVSVFALEPNIKNADVKVSVSGGASIDGDATKKVSFSSIGDEFVNFTLKTGALPSPIRITLTASSGTHLAQQDIDIEIRDISRQTTQVRDTVLESGTTWKSTIDLPGVAGSNKALLEISKIPPIDLEKRMKYLLEYPYGCLEQTVSSLFPQLFLNRFIELSSKRKEDIQINIQNGLSRLRSFQTSTGAFSSWPGRWEEDNWGSIYSAHFIIEAKNSGYNIPPGMLEMWLRNARSKASSFSGTHKADQLVQAYRLYVLALAEAPEFSAMNRMRETPEISQQASLRLAAAYAISGQKDVANDITENLKTNGNDEHLDWQNAIYGSPERNDAMLLETLILLKRNEKAFEIAKKISTSLSDEKWQSTQSIAYSLLSLSRYTTAFPKKGKVKCLVSNDNSPEVAVSFETPVYQQQLNIKKNATFTNLSVTNSSSEQIFVRLIAHGTPQAGDEKDYKFGITLTSRYLMKDGTEIDPERIEQGTDFIAEISVRPETGKETIRNIVLSQVFPVGWEIVNSRFDDDGSKQSSYIYQDIKDDRVYTFFDLLKNDEKSFRIRLNAAFQGSFTLPPVYAEAMYDASVAALIHGKKVSVVEAGK